MTSHIVIPDVQAKPGHSFEYLTHIGNFIVKKKPEVIIQIGDFADMPSLSSYDVGKKSFEGRRYKADIDAAHQAMEALLAPIKEYNANAAKNHKPRYNPRKVITLGNHEDRIDRAINNDPKLEGVLSIRDLKYEEFGWEVHPYLDVVVIDGIAYSHYFTSGVMGRPVASPAHLLNKKHMSCVMGHVQNRGIAYGNTGDGREIKGVFVGSCYEHNEDYLGAQGNNYWRGIWMFHNVDNGSFDELAIPLSYLRKKYN